jgi:hypothetical protein
MDIITFMVTVYCLVDDWLGDTKLRERGPEPTLKDSEVLTMEIVGEFLGIDEDQGLYGYFRQHWLGTFPNLGKVHRTTFTRQAANLWAVKHLLWQALLTQIAFDPEISTIDSFPVPVCRFARANRCRLFDGHAAFGHDELARQTFYGFRAHVRICHPGVIVAFDLAPANVHDLVMADELTEHAQGWLLGDRNYWSPHLRELLSERRLALIAPYKSAKRERQRLPLAITHLRRRIETVFGQLVGRFNAKVRYARDLWHLTVRWIRKILAHTVAVFLCQQYDASTSLRFAELIVH